MNKDLLDFVRVLSENDKKNLCQKALKTSEEVGELAKAVLPFENAAGTLHRFSDRRKILENVADVILSAISIAYDMKFTDEAIEDMMLEKSKKWQGIQAKEDKTKFPLPYEIHVTVQRPDDVEEFKKVCGVIGVKPIIIELEKNQEVIMQDVMTSSVHFGDNRSAYDEVERISKRLELHYFKVLRSKVETVPWHPAAPTRNGESKMPMACYFESHLRIVTDKERYNNLRTIAEFHNAHLSRNFFKKLSETEYIIMMTLRSYDDNAENFKSKVEALKKDLIDMNYNVDKVEIEFAVYDTKTTHDIAWIGK